MPPRTDTPSGSLWRHRDFRRYLTGQAASVAGSSITQMALPVLAVLHLDATTAQVAWLAFLGQLPPALLALHAGALADRYSKRRQMITGDLVSAAVLAAVPVSAALGTLTLAQLMIVAVVQGAASVLHDAAAISLLPSLVERSLIQRSNSRVGALFAVAATAGSHLDALEESEVPSARSRHRRRGLADHRRRLPDRNEPPGRMNGDYAERHQSGSPAAGRPRLLQGNGSSHSGGVLVRLRPVRTRRHHDQRFWHAPLLDIERPSRSGTRA